MRVIVPSEAVAADAVAQLGVERGRVVVIPHAADTAMRPRAEPEVAAVRERFGLPERYLVWVGALQHPDPGKHVAQLAATPRTLPLVLVTFFFSLSCRFPQHRKVARWTFPLWFYVSVTGVITYVMLRLAQGR